MYNSLFVITYKIFYYLYIFSRNDDECYTILSYIISGSICSIRGIRVFIILCYIFLIMCVNSINMQMSPRVVYWDICIIDTALVVIQPFSNAIYYRQFLWHILCVICWSCLLFVVTNYSYKYLGIDSILAYWCKTYINLLQACGTILCINIWGSAILFCSKRTSIVFWLYT